MASLLPLKTTSLPKAFSPRPPPQFSETLSLQSILPPWKSCAMLEQLWLDLPTWTRWAWVHSDCTDTRENLSRTQSMRVTSQVDHQPVVLSSSSPTRRWAPWVRTLAAQLTIQLTAADCSRWSHRLGAFPDSVKSSILHLMKLQVLLDTLSMMYTPSSVSMIISDN